MEDLTLSQLRIACRNRDIAADIDTKDRKELLCLLGDYNASFIPPGPFIGSEFQRMRLSVIDRVLFCHERGREKEAAELLALHGIIPFYTLEKLKKGALLHEITAEEQQKILLGQSVDKRILLSSGRVIRGSVSLVDMRR